MNLKWAIFLFFFFFFLHVSVAAGTLDSPSTLDFLWSGKLRCPAVSMGYHYPHGGNDSTAVFVLVNITQYEQWKQRGGEREGAL